MNLPWTTEKPKDPGWYLAYFPHEVVEGGAIEAMLFVREEGALTASCTVARLVKEPTRTFSPDMFTATHWCGPVTDPSAEDEQQMTESEFNRLLNGPLAHPAVMFRLTRLSIALRAVLDATGPIGANALREHCAERDRQDSPREGGE